MLAEYDREDGAEDFGQLARRLFSDTFVKKPVSEDTRKHLTYNTPVPAGSTHAVTA